VKEQNISVLSLFDDKLVIFDFSAVVLFVMCMEESSFSTLISR